jgi:hypothetical protein
LDRSRLVRDFPGAFHCIAGFSRATTGLASREKRDVIGEKGEVNVIGRLFCIDAGATAYFDRNESHGIYGTGH